MPLSVRPKEVSRAKKRPLDRPCMTCGAALFGLTARDVERKKYCSWTCAGTASRLARRGNVVLIAEKVCARCGAAYLGRPQTKYCGTKCTNAAMMARLANRRESIEHHLHGLSKRPGRKEIGGTFLMALFKSQGGRCALTGVEMTWATGRGHIATNASIDRIEPKGAYVPGNVRLVCLAINLMRRDMADEEFVAWCAMVAAGARGLMKVA